jgi:hypothetical protein
MIVPNFNFPYAKLYRATFYICFTQRQLKFEWFYIFGCKKNWQVMTQRISVEQRGAYARKGSVQTVKSERINGLGQSQKCMARTETGFEAVAPAVMKR